MLNMRDFARSGHVTRWHSVRVGRAQTLAEHQYLVAMIARELTHRILPAATAEEKLLLLEYCLLHDAPELLTGDIPSPMKRRIEQLCGDIVNPFTILDDEICPELGPLKNQIKHSPLSRIVKLADIIDAIVFIAVEGIGSHALAVREKLECQFQRFLISSAEAFPECDWSIAGDILTEMISGPDNQIEFEL